MDTEMLLISLLVGVIIGLIIGATLAKPNITNR